MADCNAPDTPHNAPAAPVAAVFIAAAATDDAPAVRPYRKGEAPLKREYLKPIPQKSDVVAEAPAAAASVDGDEKKRGGGGTFKKRPLDAEEDPADRLCRPIAAGESCPFGDSCKFSHDMSDYMKRKEKDLGDKCPVFDAVGFCRYGLACRFANAHVVKKEDGTYENITDPDRTHKTADGNDAGVFECNELTNEVRTLLRKNKYPFQTKMQTKKGNRHQKGNKKQQEKAAAQAEGESTTDATAAAADGAAPAEATGVSDDILEPASESPLLPERKPVDFKRKIYIAPLTTVGNLPFRRLLKQTGADITCGEMALATNLLRAQQSEWALLRRHESEDVFGVQIAGGHSDQIARVCELIARETNVDFIDINMGCPIDVVCSAGAGASLMTRPPRLMEVISGGLTGIELGSRGRAKAPGLTVKLRTGWTDKQPVAHKLISKIQGVRSSNAFMNASVVQDYKLRAFQGVDAITVHGRSRLQRYTKNADWDYVFECSDAQDETQPKVPFVGGGDVLSYEEFHKHLENGKLDTCMIARGALIKPWLPTEIKERRHWDISASERLDLLKDFVRFGLEHWGSDQKGINRTRRYLLEWQSFLCRYIPVGLLEVLPQKINDRPSPYYGRNDLETLMASDQAVDWVKISEMLLGPVPSGFQFMPKHKANAYG
uniref:tRNA-dihydrouridine(47) synthase [NAD(P)(+)] n=1 Tax=Globisporangium ultimum (strain ATCC 200006 / CBS 805.95 / DAOM BR144) TaxID=431595 RepID=K3WU99_GLOUD